MIYEAIAAALVALAVIALIAGPLLGRGAAAPLGVDEPEELEETPKGMALAALKEIEFDRETGKLSDEDYGALKTKYTAEALVILRQESGSSGEPATQVPEPASMAAAAPAGTGGSGDDAVEAMIAARVKTLQASAIRCPSCGPRPESDALFCSACGRSLAVGGCGACGAPLVPGSRFCESCGSAVGA